MPKATKPARGPRRWVSSTTLVLVFLALTIVPAFIAYALTPRDAQVVTSVQGWNGCAYTVRRGDNLFRVGVRYGVTYQYLAQINGIYNPNYITAGQVISVPCGPVPYHPVPNYPTGGKVYPPYQCPWCQPFDIPANCGNTIQYTVQPGDNLFRIAVNNGSTIQWIRTQNNLWGKVLRPGMVLNVPCQGYAKYPNIMTPTGGPPPPIITATFVPPPTSPASDRVRIRNQQFNPASRTVKAGTTVTWQNTEPANGPSYDVTSGQPGAPTNVFASGNLPPGATFQFTFTTAGVYSYYSTTNPESMLGQIIVEP